MLLSYGCAHLNCLHVKEYRKEAVYDGSSYQFTKTRLHVLATFTPSTQQDSYAFDPRYDAENRLPVAYVPPSVNPRAAAGNNPALPIVAIGAPNFSLPTGQPPIRTGVPAVVSERSLRHALLQPRQQLVFSVGGIVSLYSPLPGMQVDCVDGPKPVFCNVTAMSGSRTWWVEFCVETYQNDCAFMATQVPAILSHVFEMSQELDEDYFTKQVIRGRVLFRADALARMGTEADHYRQLLAIGIPQGCKRESIKVHVGNPRNQIDYEIVDRQLPLGWTEAGVTRLKAEHAYRITKDEYQKAIGGIQLTSPGTWFNVATGALPSNTHTVTVEVWGGYNSTRQGLEAFARQIIKTRLDGLMQRLSVLANTAESGGWWASLKKFIKLGSFGVDLSVIHDITGKHVRVQQVFVTGPISSLLYAQPGMANLSTSDLGLFPDTDDTGTLIQVNATPAGPPGDGRSRGSFIGQAIASAFQSSCDIPPYPNFWPGPGMVTNNTPPYLTSNLNPYLSR